MLVNLPDADAGYRDSNEGGLAFFFLIPALDNPNERQVCMAGQIYWPEQDVIVNDDDYLDDSKWGPQAIDGGLLIGSTGQSLFHDDHGYFSPTLRDLTDSGDQLYGLLTGIYGVPPAIVTLLDT